MQSTWRALGKHRERTWSLRGYVDWRDYLVRFKLIIMIIILIIIIIIIIIIHRPPL